MPRNAPGPGRPRTFDEAEALDAALGLFWQQGYRATTTRNLEAALAMSQPSIYNAFGSKRDLLFRAMDRYEARVDAELLSILRSGDDGYEAIERFMIELARWIHENRNRGCLMVNLMAGDPVDEAITARVEQYRSKIHEAFVAALERTERNPDLVTVRADLLLAAVLGLHITARTAGTGPAVAAMAGHIGQQVAEWRVASANAAG